MSQQQSEYGQMTAIIRAGRRNQVWVAMLPVCFALATVACGTTITGNCNAQGGNNGVTCIQSGGPAGGSSSIPTEPPKSQPTPTPSQVFSGDVLLSSNLDLD